MNKRYVSEGPWCHRVVLSLFAAAVLITTPVIGQAPPPKGGDLLDEARQRERIAVQKAEADFRSAIKEVHRLASTNPEEAVQRLKQILSSLENDTVFSESRRERWKTMLKDRIRVLEGEAANRAREKTDQTQRQIEGDARRETAERRAQEDDKIKEEIANIRRLRDQGRIEEATRKAEDLERRYPSNPSLGPAARITGTAGRLAESREMRRTREANIELAMREVARSAIPPRGDIEFPSREKWERITKMRSKPNLTEKEKTLMKALDSPVTVSFQGSNFQGVLDYLETVTGQPIVLDKATLEAAGIDYNTAINTSVRNVSLRTLLRKILGQVSLTYVIKNEAIQIVTPQQARDMMTVRTYYLGDLSGVADFQFGPVFGAAQMQQTVTQLIQLITGTIDPDSWAVNNTGENTGGKGIIYFDARTLTLIVKQSAEVHYLLGGLGR
jgi:hypothetical protein